MTKASLHHWCLVSCVAHNNRPWFWFDLTFSVLASQLNLNIWRPLRYSPKKINQAAVWQSSLKPAQGSDRSQVPDQHRFCQRTGAGPTHPFVSSWVYLLDTGARFNVDPRHCQILLVSAGTIFQKPPSGFWPLGLTCTSATGQVQYHSVPFMRCLWTHPV